MKEDPYNGNRTQTGRAYYHPTCRCQLTSNRHYQKPSSHNSNNNISSHKKSPSLISSKRIYSNWCKGFITSWLRTKVSKIYTLLISKRRISIFRRCGMCILVITCRKIILVLMFLILFKSNLIKIQNKKVIRICPIGRFLSKFKSRPDHSLKITFLIPIKIISFSQIYFKTQINTHSKINKS